MTPHLHFMGIGGISMSGLARHYHAEGYRVSGCDAADTPTTAALRAEGIDVHACHDPAHIAGVDTLISTMAVPNPNVPAGVAEVAAAEAAGVRSIKRIDLLAQLFRERHALAVTGSHGKSTITGMLALIALELAEDPSVQLGATLTQLGSNMRHGRGPLLVAEVDESDPGFARLGAFVGLIANLEDDHIAGEYGERRNYHASLADLESAALGFARGAERLVLCADWPGLRELAGHLPHRSYGEAADADYRITEVELAAAGSRFALTAPGGERVEATLAVPGRHNVQNAAAALTVAHQAGLPLAAAARALAGFAGVGRRWQRWGTVRGALVIDDYAHHPTEVATTLTTARNTGRRVRAVLQPHRWVRTARHWRALADAAAAADEVLVLDIYAAGESVIPGVDSGLIVERLLATGRNASRHDHASAVRYLRDTLEDGDLVITLGAGDVWRVAAELAQEEVPVAGR